MSRPEEAVERCARWKPAVDLTLIRTQLLIMRMVLAQAGLSQPGPALWRIVGVQELVQLDLEEMLIECPRGGSGRR